ncbi:MAG: hypothetical protein FH758_01330 [Firmicutes bacterium]|nr:hypothetical protein [Bacillota bacterium]
MAWLLVLLSATAVLYILHPNLELLVVRKALGITLAISIFYIVGHYLTGWLFPTPIVIVQILNVVGLGVALGVIFSKIWPLNPRPGLERIIRTVLIVIPALGLGIGLQVLLQGNNATQAIYLIFALSSWLGSGHFVRRTEATAANSNEGGKT